MPRCYQNSRLTVRRVTATAIVVAILFVPDLLGTDAAYASGAPSGVERSNLQHAAPGRSFATTADPTASFSDVVHLASNGRTTTFDFPEVSSPTYIGIGNTSVMPSATKNTTAVVAVTLSSPLSHRTNFSYRTSSGSALAVANYVAETGSSYFSSDKAASKSVQRDIDITIPSQKLSAPSSFEVTLSGITKGATIVNSVGVIDLLSNQSAAPSSMLSIGDSSLYKSVSGVKRALETPITLSKPLISPLSVSYKTVSDVGIAPQDYKGKNGAVIFTPGQVQKDVTIAIDNNANNLPNRIFYIDISTKSTAVSVLKGISDQILINGPNTGLVTTTNPGLSIADLTPDRSASTHLFDTFVMDNTSVSTTINGNSSNSGANSRFVFYPTNEQPSQDQETCATWQGQTPTNGSGSIVQEGLALRISNSGGVTKAITITKNVFGSNDLQRPANATFDVILWDSRIPNFNFRGILGTTLTTLWPNGHYVPMPWSICGKVVGNVVSFVVWPSTMGQPAWNDPNYGGSATIPASDLSNWTYSGYAGWYFGHVTKTSSEVYTNMSTQGL